MRSILALLLAVTAGCGLWPGRSGPAPQAVAEIRNAVGQPVGEATFVETSQGITITVKVRGLMDGVRAVHIHEIGRCVGPGFESAGGHFDPHHRGHGLKSPKGPHAGDLPNLAVNEMGRGTLTFTTSLITLRGRVDSILSSDGTAIVIHTEQDDEAMDPPGEYGGRLACGVIVPAGSRP